MSKFLAMGISAAVGGGLALVLTFVGVSQISPTAKQPDAPLIVYGSN